MAAPAEAESGPVVEPIADRSELPAALGRIGLQPGTPVLVSVGGAGGMSEQDLEAMRYLLQDHVLPLLAELGAAVVDGGTDAGVMRVMGQVRSSTGAEVPLVGVVAAGTVRLPGRSAGPDAADPEPHHTALLMVPGEEWGDESPWISDVAHAVADGAPSATLLVNGGEIAYQDVQHSVAANRPVVVVAGTGRAADALAAALCGDPAADPRATELARSGLLRAANLADTGEVTTLMRQLLIR